MTDKEYQAGMAALADAVSNDRFMTALAFIYQQIPMDADMFSENPYRNAYYTGQKSVGLTIRRLLGKQNCIRLDSVKL